MAARRRDVTRLQVRLREPACRCRRENRRQGDGQEDRSKEDRAETGGAVAKQAVRCSAGKGASSPHVTSPDPYRILGSATAYRRSARRAPTCVRTAPRRVSPSSVVRSLLWI